MANPALRGYSNSLYVCLRVSPQDKSKQVETRTVEFGSYMLSVTRSGVQGQGRSGVHG